MPGTWIGGDRDGNPNVTPEVTRQALDLMRSAAIGLLDERLLELAGSLSVAESISGPAPLLDPLIQIWRIDSRKWPRRSFVSTPANPIGRR